MVVASLAEVAQHMGAPIANYIDVNFFFFFNFYIDPLFYCFCTFVIHSEHYIMLQVVMPLVLKELASPEPTNRRNAAFCAGELCKNGGESVLKYPWHKT